MNVLESNQIGRLITTDVQYRLEMTWAKDKDPQDPEHEWVQNPYVVRVWETTMPRAKPQHGKSSSIAEAK
jgi:hypothetical protein